VPRAAIALKQGFGRLIRRKDDRGIVAILDHPNPHQELRPARSWPRCPGGAHLGARTSAALVVAFRPVIVAPRRRRHAGRGLPERLGAVRVAGGDARAASTCARSAAATSAPPTWRARWARKTGALVLLLDALKGLGPALATRLLWPGEPLLAAGAGLFAILGHVFPVWLKLHGGKGVATGLGVFLALTPLATGVAAAFFFAVYATKRIVTRSARSRPRRSCRWRCWCCTSPCPSWPSAWRCGCWCWCATSSNIQRLLRREERKL
jgi:glycerol-3-phosphate acyltransferase PlsY